MTVVIHGTHELVDELIRLRRALGQDGYDEVWDGVYHMAAPIHSHHGLLQAELGARLHSRAKALGFVLVGAFNLGENENDYRVPAFGALADRPGTTLYVPTAVMVGEVLSQDGQTFNKFDFYAKRGVAEIVVVDPFNREITCYALYKNWTYNLTDTITCAGITTSDLTDLIDWS